MLPYIYIYILESAAALKRGLDSSWGGCAPPNPPLLYTHNCHLPPDNDDRCRSLCPGQVPSPGTLVPDSLATHGPFVHMTKCIGPFLPDTGGLSSFQYR